MLELSPSARGCPAANRLHPRSPRRTARTTWSPCATPWRPGNNVQRGLPADCGATSFGAKSAAAAGQVSILRQNIRLPRRPLRPTRAGAHPPLREHLGASSPCLAPPNDTFFSSSGGRASERGTVSHVKLERSLPRGAWRSLPGREPSLWLISTRYHFYSFHTVGRGWTPCKNLCVRPRGVAFVLRR